MRRFLGRVDGLRESQLEAACIIGTDGVKGGSVD